MKVIRKDIGLPNEILALDAPVIVIEHEGMVFEIRTLRGSKNLVLTVPDRRTLGPEPIRRIYVEPLANGFSVMQAIVDPEEK